MDQSDLSLEFKTEGNDGILLYVGDAKFIDSIALYMQAGKLFFSFNCGGGTAIIKTEKTYNDGEWHMVEISRQRRTGHIKVDGQDEQHGHSPNEESSLNVKSPIFVGGLSEVAAKGTVNIMRGIGNSFPGCIRKVIVQGQLQKLGRDSIGYDTQPCSSKSESGVFFHAGGGYLKVKDKFWVGLKITIDIQIKPRNTSGVILSVHGVTDYLVLQIVDGVVKMTVNNGAGPIEATYALPADSNLCDGEWHTVQATKEANLVTLNVDNVHFGLGMGLGGVSSTDTNNPLYVGGVPDPSKPGIETSDSFVGCMRGLEISNRPIGLTDATAYGAVSLSACPTI
jgi:laminin alpha 3/5